MLRINFIEESSIWHKHSVVGCALYKHPPFLQRCRFNSSRTTSSNKITSLRSSVHITSNLRLEYSQMISYIIIITHPMQSAGHDIICDYIRVAYRGEDGVKCPLHSKFDPYPQPPGIPNV